MKKIEESKKSPMNSKDFADYMRHNLELAKQMEAASKQSSVRLNNMPNPQAPIRLTLLLVLLAKPATQVMIDTYMSALDFTKENDEGRYSNSSYVLWDVVPRNVLADADGDMYVIDASRVVRYN